MSRWAWELLSAVLMFAAVTVFVVATQAPELVPLWAGIAGVGVLILAALAAGNQAEER